LILRFPVHELYDLSADPLEQTNLVATSPAVAEGQAELAEETVKGLKYLVTSAEAPERAHFRPALDSWLVDR